MLNCPLCRPHVCYEGEDVPLVGLLIAEWKEKEGACEAWSETTGLMDLWSEAFCSTALSNSGRWEEILMAS